MPSERDHADMMLRLLPEGDCWPGNTDGTWDWDKVAVMLAGEPARVDDDGLAFIENYFPDTAVDFLPDWERVLGLSRGAFSTAQRQAQIIAKLAARGYIDRATIEQVLQTRRQDTNLRLLHKLHPMFSMGMGVGQPLNGPQWPATWTCEYMPDILGGTPDNTFSGTAITNAFYQSPVSEDQDAAKVIFGASGFDLFIVSDFVGTADGDIVHFSCWLRNDGGAPGSDIQVKFAKRDGTLSTAVDIHLGGSAWVKVFYRASLGSGATQPAVLLTGNTQQIRLAWSHAGIVDETFEAYAESLPPLNTAGEFAVIGENP